MKILILGSKGFIGAACYSYFKSLDRINAFGADVVAEYDDANYFLIDGSNNDFREIFSNHQFDYCINCAGAASVPDSFKNPLRDYLLNVQHVVHILNAIKDESPSCKLIQLSSAAVYGNPQVLPIKEDHPLKPMSPYGVHKKQAEELCWLYHEQYDVNCTILRLFSAYGANLKKQLFWDLYKKSQAGTDLTLFGTGNETREFIHVSDIVNAISQVITNTGPGFNIINVANSNNIPSPKPPGYF
ncbi:MAG TPA: SDR family oxidoreductase [Mucilaginibacter sp.]